MCSDKIEFIDQRFITLALDIAYLLNESDKSKSEILKCTFVRSAISNLVPLVECVSNSCLFSLKLPTKLIEELDKLPPLAKLDYFLFIHTKNHIDRSRHQTELLVGVLKLRDQIVHPKPNSGKLSLKSINEQIDYGVSKALKIPLDTREWTLVTAVLIKNIVFKFLINFFKVSCSFDIGRVTTILGMREKKLFHEQKYGTYFTVPKEEYVVIMKNLPELLDCFDVRLSTN